MATNVFPLYLDAPAVAVATGASDVTPTSSFYILASGALVTLLDAEKVGTIVNFVCPSSVADATVTLATSADGAAVDKVTFAGNSSNATAVWFSDGWRWVFYRDGSLA